MRGKTIVAAVVVALAGAWALSSVVLVPWLIGSAYRGETFAVLAGLMRERGNVPLARYQERWDDLARNITAMLVIVSVAGAVIVGPVLAGRSAERSGGEAFAPALRIGLGRWRRRLVQAAVALLVSGSLVDIVFDVEHWPFSPYAMYATVARRDRLTLPRLFGVREDTGAEIPLTAESEIAPFDRSRLASALGRLHRLGDEERLRVALLDCLRRYERRRAQGRHHGPPLTEVRLYQVSWRPDPWAVNASVPTEKRLLGAVSRPGGTDLRERP
jgi:hypothetical protein